MRPIESSSGRKTGVVFRVLGDYGFVSCDEYPDQDIYFKPAWFQGSPALAEGESVTFQLKSYDGNLQAHYLTRAAAEGGVSQPAQPPGLPQSHNILQWAYLGYLPNILSELKGLALDEQWDFRDEASNPDKPHPILYSYLFHTFGRLVLEDKILINGNASYAAFNTGLVDDRYEPIHALFVPNDDRRSSPWQLTGFCIAGEGADGQNLVRHFTPLPSTAHYFEHPVDLLYDTRAGEPRLDWRHIITERIDRYPKDFVQDHWPQGYEAKDDQSLNEDERKAYYRGLGEAIEHDSRTYRRIMNRVKDAIDLSIKRVAWNFKTAIPTYYPRVKHLQLLLPLCLLSDDHVDLALAVEKTPSGSYLGHTVLPLDWAYKNARLVCRPDSDWLIPEQIEEQSADEDGT